MTEGTFSRGVPLINQRKTTWFLRRFDDVVTDVVSLVSKSASDSVVIALELKKLIWETVSLKIERINGTQ